MIVTKQLAQLLVLDSTVQMVPGIVKLVQYSVDDIGPMVSTALPALVTVSVRGTQAAKSSRWASAAVARVCHRLPSWPICVLLEILIER